MWRLEASSSEALASAFEPLLARGEADLLEEGFGREAIRIEPALDLRYRGQSFELTLPIEDFDLAQAARHFHASHEQRYSYARPDAPVELVNIRLTARGLRPLPPLGSHAPAASRDPAPAQVSELQLRHDGEWLGAPAYERSRLQPGHTLRGPALVVQEDATTVITPGWHARVDPWLNLICIRCDDHDH